MEPLDIIKGLLKGIADIENGEEYLSIFVPLSYYIEALKYIEDNNMNFIYMCALTGIADYIYNKDKRPPKWMNKKEELAWRLGYKYAAQQS